MYDDDDDDDDGDDDDDDDNYIARILQFIGVSVYKKILVYRVTVSALASINEVNLRRARLVLRWATVSGLNSRCQALISVYNQPATQGQLSLPSLRGR